MKLTCIIPCYKQAEFLPDAIESALQADEVIVIDDGSPDASAQIASHYPVKLIRQVNKGLASARNTGIMNASGDYILPLDSDDILMDGAVESIKKAIEVTNADIIAPSFKTFGLRSQSVILDAVPKLSDFFTANRIGYFSAVRKSALLEIGGYNPKMTFGWEDYDLWIDLLKRGKTIATITETLVLYRIKEISMITEANKHAIDLANQMRRNHPEFPELFIQNA